MCLCVSACLGEALKSSSSLPCGSELIKEVNSLASKCKKPALNIYETRCTSGHRDDARAPYGIMVKDFSFQQSCSLFFPVLFAHTPYTPLPAPHPRTSTFTPPVLLASNYRNFRPIGELSIAPFVKAVQPLLQAIKTD